MLERIRVFLFGVFCLTVFSFVILSLDNYDKKSVEVISNNRIFPTVIIDAGHGGRDGGAVAPDGTHEADINLEIANDLNAFLSFMGFDILMTRTDENSIGDTDGTIRNEKVSDIHKRFEIMNSVENCLFVSIHQNMYSGSSSWGTQTFYSQNNPESKTLASYIQSNILNNLQPDNKRVIKPSGKEIYLLYNALKPAVMVECGFLSNKDDLNNLKNAEYQRKTAFCIMSGITDYLSEG